MNPYHTAARDLYDAVERAATFHGLNTLAEHARMARARLPMEGDNLFCDLFRTRPV